MTADAKHAPPYPNAATDPFNKVPGMNKPRESVTADVNITSNIKLLPLPEPAFTGMSIPYYTSDQVRACVAHATAAKDAENEALVKQRDFLVEEYERAVGCGPQGYTHAAMHLFNAIANAKADENTKAIEALRAEVERLQEIARPLRKEEWLSLDHWRMRAYDLEANWSRCSRACANEQTKRIEAEARAERLAEALQWYVDNDDTNDGQEGNEFWLAGRDRARALLEQEK